MTRNAYGNKLAYEVKITYLHIEGYEPETTRCLMITDCEPTKNSIREGHLVKFAYFPDDIMRSDFMSNELLKFEDVISVKCRKISTRKDTLKVFGHAKRWLDAFVKNKKNNLNSGKTKQDNLARLLFEIRRGK